MIRAGFSLLPVLIITILYGNILTGGLKNNIGYLLTAEMMWQHQPDVALGPFKVVTATILTNDIAKSITSVSSGSALYLAIALSFFIISVTILYFILKHKVESAFLRFSLLLFVILFLMVGLIFLLQSSSSLNPSHQTWIIITIATAIVSLIAAVALLKVIPQIMEFKSAREFEKMVEGRTAELRALNARLQDEIGQKKRAEQKLKQLYSELEEKTKGVEEMNKELILRERDFLKSEEKVRQLNLELERKVEERTEQLNASNHEMEAFTYSVSHDLRAPLRAIDGYTRILEEDYNPRLDANGKRLIQVITKNAKYMGQLIDDLLEFSRTSKVPVTKTRFNTDEEVRRICSELLSQEQNRKIEIDIQSLIPCKGDINMLRQIWINLVSNALKYSRKTAETFISITSEQRGEEVMYKVKDNGVGFDMNYVEKLFGVFQRLHKKEEFEGTGVGLALVKRIIDRHGGKIWAEAEVNKGATFYFTLPD
ncbi:sensor histidine kinase [Chryseosolibacter indicus]|uniref:histidine kinase n=1 Tax=Chryseosolibacter indicus TaxID=2782351 RepID=A0ABS5VR92_9BACT|nr:ATP-binding protein [Chryseosolibacter indicus]MBT1703340.1 GHKL domain-containing protein [Chryseosolibacter indicus]